jgi:L-lysine 2,3-aminomutase
MPTYCFRNNDTGEVHEEMIKMDDREQYLKDHPELTQVLEMPQIVSGTDGLRKPDDSFRDILRNINKKHKSRKNTMNKNSDF